MAAGPKAVVRRPPFDPPRHSLVQAARDATGDETEGRWENGFLYESAGCGASVDITDPCQSESFGGTADTTEEDRDTFLLRARHRCSPFAWTQEQYVERARQALRACESQQLASELWRGDVTRARGFANPYLTHLDSDVLTEGGTSPTDALACLEEALTHECRCGQRGMIHATAQVATHWRANNLVRNEGGQLLTLMDTIVVVDSGYDGSGPQGIADGDPTPAADGSIWAYATDVVSVRLSDITVLPGDVAEAQAMASAIDKGLNTVDVYAERIGVAEWDGCCHFAVELDLNLCDVGGAGS